MHLKYLAKNKLHGKSSSHESFHLTPKLKGYYPFSAKIWGRTWELKEEEIMKNERKITFLCITIYISEYFHLQTKSLILHKQLPYFHKILSSRCNKTSKSWYYYIFNRISGDSREIFEVIAIWTKWSICLWI